MVTGKSPCRRRLAEVALEAFRRQSYRRAELLVINTAGESWVPGDDAGGRIREIFADPKLSLGALRNLAFGRAAGEYLLQWDDDDFHGARRIQNQLAALPRGPANLLQHEIFDFCDAPPRVVSAARWGYRGFPGSILHPRRVAARYPEVARGEDSEFLRRLSAEIRIHAIDNDPRDYVRLVHGANTWERAHFDRLLESARLLEKRERQHLDNVRWFVAHFGRPNGALAPAPEAIDRLISPVPWMRLPQARRIQRLVREHRLARILEIGTMHGAGTTHLAAAASHVAGHVTTVDVPASARNCPRAEDLLTAAGLSNRATVIRRRQGIATQFHDWITGGAAPKFDLVYVDGDHSFAAAARDLEIAIRLLRPGGWLVMDDVGVPKWSDVTRVWVKRAMRDSRLDAHEVWRQWGIARKRSQA